MHKYFIKKLINLFNYRIINLRTNTRSRLKGVNLNIGCGRYIIKGLINLDYHSEAYYGSKKFKHIHYDMRNDLIPFDDNCVDNIYCSHVIEHIETKHVKKFLHECFRVLKKDGVLRIVCPDAEYLYYQLIHYPKFFSWHKYFRNSNSNAFKCFVELIAEPKCELENFGLKKKITDYQYSNLIEELISDLLFDQKNPGNHINYWDYNKVLKFGREAKFTKILKSRFQSSVQEAFRGRDMDLAQPIIALHVDLIK